MAQLQDFPRYYINCPIAIQSTCTICAPNKHYNNHGDLNRHLKNIHHRRIGWQCSSCPEQFNDIRSCKAHQRRAGHGTDTNNDDSADTPSMPITEDINSTPDLEMDVVASASQPTPSTSTDSQIPQARRYQPNQNQKKWMASIIRCNSVDEVEAVANEWIIEIQDSIPNRQPSNSYRPRQQRHVVPMTAARLQKLYRSNRKRAMQYIDNQGKKSCPVELEEIQEYFVLAGQRTNCMMGDRPTIFTPDSIISEDPLSRPFTPEEILNKLAKASDSSPGEDGITYRTLMKSDPKCLILHSIYNKCRALRKTPNSWKRSVTILIYKKGPQENLDNWRPIAMSNTIAKLFASCVASRLTSWAITNNRISRCQKGFMPDEGCLQHNFHLHSMIEDARRNGKKICIAWLDLKNAFGSIPHEFILDALKTMGLGEFSLSLIEDMYTGCLTRVKTDLGVTDDIDVMQGVKQGCPSSPITFNLALELVIRAITNIESETGYELFGTTTNILVYADDMVLVSNSEAGLQKLLDTINVSNNWTGLKFNTSKCATLVICGKSRKTLPLNFSLGNDVIPALGDNDSYVYLGAKAGFKLDKNIDGTLASIKSLSMI